MRSLQERVTDLERKLRHVLGRGTTPNQYTTAQRDAIDPKVKGKIIFNTDDNINQYWDGSAWIDMT